MGNKKTSDYLHKILFFKIFSISAIRIITTTYKLAIFPISFYEIMSTFRAFSIIKKYISKSKFSSTFWRKIANIWTTSPRYSKFKRQYLIPIKHIFKLLIKKSFFRKVKIQNQGIEYEPRQLKQIELLSLSQGKQNDLFPLFSIRQTLQGIYLSSRIREYNGEFSYFYYFPININIFGGNV